MEAYYPIADPDFLANLRSESLESFQPQLAIKTHGCDVEMPRSKAFPVPAFVYRIGVAGMTFYRPTCRQEA